MRGNCNLFPQLRIWQKITLKVYAISLILCAKLAVQYLSVVLLVEKLIFNACLFLAAIISACNLYRDEICYC